MKGTSFWCQNINEIYNNWIVSCDVVWKKSYIYIFNDSLSFET